MGTALGLRRVRPSAVTTQACARRRRRRLGGGPLAPRDRNSGRFASYEILSCIVGSNNESSPVLARVREAKSEAVALEQAVGSPAVQHLRRLAGELGPVPPQLLQSCHQRARGRATRSWSTSTRSKKVSRSHSGRLFRRGHRSGLPRSSSSTRAGSTCTKLWSSTQPCGNAWSR